MSFNPRATARDAAKLTSSKQSPRPMEEWEQKIWKIVSQTPESPSKPPDDIKGKGEVRFVSKRTGAQKIVPVDWELGGTSLNILPDRDRILNMHKMSACMNDVLAWKELIGEYDARELYYPWIMKKIKDLDSECKATHKHKRSGIEYQFRVKGNR